MDGRAPAIDRHHQLLIDSGRVLMLIGSIVITRQLVVREAASSNAEHVLLAFILWLLGAAFVMLWIVARRFPGSRPPAPLLRARCATTGSAAVSESAWQSTRPRWQSTGGQLASVHPLSLRRSAAAYPTYRMQFLFNRHILTSPT
uniref:Uncharacterized protein n=1 Tax=Setaria italica TaxID=4555 RepID=K3Y1B6_SETIT